MANDIRPYRPVHLAVELPDPFKTLFADVFDLVEPKAAVALVVRGSRKLGAAELAAFPALQRIVCIGTGRDGIDVQAAEACGVTVATTEGANAGSVAEFALTLILASVRDLQGAVDHVKSGGWSQGRLPALSAPGLHGRRVGVVGLGTIGRRVAQLVEAFGAHVAWTGPRPKPDVAWRYMAGLAPLAEWSDVLVLCHAANPADPPAVNAEVLARLGSTGRLVNVSRGCAVDEIALASALQEGRLGGAALDVCLSEPNPSPRLVAAPRLILSPHIAGGSDVGVQAMADATIRDLMDWFDGAPVYGKSPGPSGTSRARE